MDADEINLFLSEIFPQLNPIHPDFIVTNVFDGGCSVRLNADERHLRPGDTISGPALFTLADIGGYACAIAHIGKEALAVTTNLNINFMRKAVKGPVNGHCRILKLGKSLMVFDIEIHCGTQNQIVAHATGTYALPPISRKSMVK